MELIDYVTNTPQNTNKTILKQLVSSEKNKAVYESIEELKRDGGVGYTESEKTVLTFDGNTEGKPFFMRCYKISDEVIDVNTITSLIGTASENGETVDIIEMLSAQGVAITVQENSDSAILKFEVNSAVTFLLIVIFADTDFYGTLLPKGTYVLSNDSMYISHIEAGTETIHSIDPKYLPSGGGLPVIDFGTLEAESENNFIAQVDPSLFKDYMCFVGKFTAGDDQGKSTVHMVFSCIDGIAWTGYIHTHPNFGNMEMFGIIMANGAVNAMQITMVPGTQLSE